MLIVPKVCSSNDQKQLWQLFIQKVDLKRFASRGIIHTSNLNKLSKLFIKLWSGNQENIVSATFELVIRKSSSNMTSSCGFASKANTTYSPAWLTQIFSWVLPHILFVYPWNFKPLLLFKLIQFNDIRFDKISSSSSISKISCSSCCFSSSPSSEIGNLDKASAT